MQTRAYWRNQNLSIRDEEFSPAQGVSLWETCPQLALLDPCVGHTYLEHFHNFVAADWAVTEIGAGGTEALRDGAGGQLLITTDALDDDGVQIQKVGEAFIPAAGKPIWFEAKIMLVTAAKDVQSELLVGLAITDTTVIPGRTDGIYFAKADGSALVGAVTEKASAATTTAAVLTLVPATWYKFGFWCDGVTTCYLYVNGVLVATHITNIPVVELTPTFAVLNGEAGATAWALDYFKGVQIL
jgi:hypothetical protein